MRASLRVLANFLVLAVLASSTYAIYKVVEFSQQVDKRLAEGQTVSWLESNSVSPEFIISRCSSLSLLGIVTLDAVLLYLPSIGLSGCQISALEVVQTVNMNSCYFCSCSGCLHAHVCY